MPQQPRPSVENNFVEGLKTEFTGLNFPENACTAAENCVFTLIGDVERRLGIDFELNNTTATINRSNDAMSSYIWTNVGGDGQTKVYVLQVGSSLYFYQFTNATIANPLSTTVLSSVVNIGTFLALNSIINPSTTECQFSDGNGYLFVFHPNCDPFYCTFAAGVVTANLINVQIRDFLGIIEPGVATNYRPLTLSSEHNYNLRNQGWGSSNPWTASSTSSVNLGSGTKTWTVQAGLSVTVGDSVQIKGTGGGYVYLEWGNVSAYTGTSLSILVISTIYNSNPLLISSWTFADYSGGFINTWFTALGNYPSNADVWWNYKDASGVFAPTPTSVANWSTANTPAPQGSIILNAFSQLRSTATGISGLTDVITSVRPRTGCWFQGRVFYSGVDASQPATGDATFYTWTENIYFSQIIETNNTSEFGLCYQTNDPTSETLFNLLPSDGGVITIQGSGAIYKLFPIQNGLLVFAANGIWFITGSQGIGFSATDYTITKISGIQSISGTSHINVMGYPMFWNEEGIYGVAPSQSGSLTVNNLCLGTILSFYNNIPLQSKKFVRGDYDPITFTIKWVYRSTNESSVTDRYQYDSVLNFNVIHKSFYPYSLPNGSSPNIHDVKYVQSPGGTGAPLPIMKYLTSYSFGGTYKFTFSEENNSNYVDWGAINGIGIPFVSTFTTGYKVHGNALTKFQAQWAYVYMRRPSAYTINAVWDFANNPNSGKYSVHQQSTNYILPTRDYLYRRHRLRGRGISLQLEFTSIPNQPFDLIGWAIFSQVNVRP